MQQATLSRPRALLGAAFAAVLALAPAAAAQQVAISAGQTVNGTLTASSPKMDDGSHYQLYTYHGRAGEHLTITLRSSAFDAYLAFGKMVNGELDAQDTDDDGAGGTDAKIETTLTADGDYVIRANTLSEGETGAFTLSVSNGPAPASASVKASFRGSISVGQTVNGALSSSDPKADDDSYYQLWSFQGRAGQTVTIDLKSSAFDAYLAVGRLNNGSFDENDSDDDGGGGTDARIVFTPSADGTYAIRANTLAAGETGAYTLSVTAGGTPTAHDQDDSSSDDAAPSIVGSIRAGQTVQGTLSSGDPRMGDASFYRDYRYEGRAGEKVTVTLRSSAFDAYLHVGRLQDGRFVSIDTDDDGAGGNDSKVELTLPATGTYLFRANTLVGGATGAFTLTVTSGS
jgi:hypothetical protein